MTDDKSFKQTINTAGFTSTPRLVLEQATGDVTIEAWDRPEIEVRLTDDEGTFELEQTGSQVVVHNRPGLGHVNFVDSMRAGFEAWGFAGEELASRLERQVDKSVRRLGRRFGGNIDFGHWAGGRDYEIRVPHNCDLNVRTSTGDLQISGVNGHIFVQSTSGDIRVDEVSGAALLTSASGDIRVEQIDGKLGARSASGDVSIREANVLELSATSASGDVTVELLAVPEREFELKSVSGDVRLDLPSDAAVTLQTRTLSGEVACEFSHSNVNHQRVGRRQSNLEINGGGTMGAISTISGDIIIERGEHRQMGTRRPVDYTSDTAAAPAPTVNLSTQGEQARVENSGSGMGSEGAEPSETAEDISQSEGYAARRASELEILQSVERGELTPHEALQRLSELDGSRSA